MTELTYQNPEIDKSAWPEGEWNHEPDKVQWKDEATGYPCLAVRNHMGALCGYVGVPPGHRFHGVGYDDVMRESEYPPAHGGLTYAGPCQENAPEGTGICHIPEPGELDDVYWLGFDCAHALDAVPSMLATRQRWMEENRIEERVEEDPEWQDTYKTIDYVKQNCAELAAWLKEAE